ncbi:MAG TPA: phosphodiester glycosidase family protein [Gemmatimonas sp.]|uniref:phosphodiester glycosidase family protein n=1 Tax=Gemmatimonas sp. TaxID=1962908 RepID=UPI002EDA7941
MRGLMPLMQIVRRRAVVTCGWLLFCAVSVPMALTAQRAPASRIAALPCSTSTTSTAATRASRLSALRWKGRDVRWAEWPVQLGARGVSATVIVVDIDPARIALALEIARDGDALAPWSLDDAPKDAVIALNAGQFTDDGPWGWVVHRRREWQAPGVGPLSAAFVIDTSGRASILQADEIGDARRRGGWEEALQSFPLILKDGAMPVGLCTPGAVDLEHRDIRLTLGTLPNGHVLLALTRYAGVGSAGNRLPIGPTTGEMATIMRELGVVRAVMLDGGLSAQMLVRDGSVTTQWSGLRRVPLALVGRRKAELAPAQMNR